MRYAVVGKKNIVDNVIEYDGKSEYKPDGKLVKLTPKSPVSPGWTYQSGEFTPPEPEPTNPPELPKSE